MSDDKHTSVPVCRRGVIVAVKIQMVVRSFHLQGSGFPPSYVAGEKPYIDRDVLPKQGMRSTAGGRENLTLLLLCGPWSSLSR